MRIADYRVRSANRLFTTRSLASSFDIRIGRHSFPHEQAHALDLMFQRLDHETVHGLDVAISVW